MYCEKCRCTYEDDKTVCDRCGRQLIDYTPILDDEDVLDLEAVSETEDVEQQTAELTPEEIVMSTEPQLLVTVEGEDEAEHICGVLEANMIPSLTRSNNELETEEGEEAIDILVPCEMLPSALEIINDVVMSDDDEKDMTDEELDELLNKLAEETENIDI